MARLRLRRLFLIIIAAGIGAVSAACQSAPEKETAPEHGIDVAGMDTSVQPGDDFNAYANGGWLKSTAIPPDKAAYGTFGILADKVRKDTAELIQGAQPSAGGDAQKTADFYASYMDEAGIETKGVTPLLERLDAISKIDSKPALARAIGATLRADVDPLNATNFQTEHLFGVFVSQGLNDPTRNYPYLLQGGLGLPDRDYYTSASPRMTELRTQYKTYVATIFNLARMPNAAAHADRVFALETRIARAHATRLESQDVKTPATWSRADLTSKAPGLDWAALLEAASLGSAQTFILWHPKATTGIAALIAGEPLDAWKDWLAFHTISENAGLLSKAFVDARFGFYGKTLSGAEAQRPRWQRGVDLTSAELGDAVGRMYVQKYFPPETKAKVEAMVRDLVQAFNARIDALTWMTPETKIKAKAKVASLRVGVGYSDKWRDYASLTIVKGDALGNVDRADLFEYKHQLAKLSAPPDKGEWWMTPQTVNAVNLPLQNALNFPAAILQPPFFDPQASAAYNYGSMGAVIGHEISHSFDDQGSQFDADGRLANWWTPEDFAHFKTAGEALAAQYDAYKPFPDLALNGHQVLSENIADVAGLSAAFDAYRASLKGAPAPEFQGFTGDQQFFISYGQSWREKYREPALRQQIATDGHAPDEYRADTVRNLDQWYQAFNVQPGQKLYLAEKDRVKVW
ncbi:MAG TPA: M13 family metallopeptidase [Vicinamibacterales bacterium]|nr:M13 family metallopeptidase [Vicinamibacterales bacterium]